MSNAYIDSPDSPKVTYSPAYTLVPTYECFNRCTYCNFRADLGKSPWMSVASAQRLLKSLSNSGIIEILVLSGEVHPMSPQRRAWCDRIYTLCELALSMGFLPHANVGPLSFAEMARLKEVNVSMGLMLESLAPQLLKTVHRYAPSKEPALRREQLQWAGELRIPFTTGLLLGIGEIASDRRATLEAIALIHQEWGHIQEVILQPYSPGEQIAEDIPGFNLQELPEVVAEAREILPSEITLQIPPNLVTEPDILLECLDAGVRDLGGIGPIDEVNPSYPHLHKEKLTAILTRKGWSLAPRLPIYPQYDSWLSESLFRAVKRFRLIRV
ncbi:MAG: 7,8-didemethyl-8-hydroxy-5-deazariboflavin synthase subunit CofG [Oscillatoria sp. SIO1A7]|nr:7,8-didemethyl-8-hydroxy-5-deazariboflavin synthase subunit CofG [Oscillatoria sp. SIO1A7]